MSQSNRSAPPPGQAGFLYGIAAYGLWGMMPLYFRAVAGVHPLELLAHRILWSVAFLGLILTLLGRLVDLVQVFKRPRLCALLLGSTLLIALNWFVFIYGVWIGQVVQNSLGYFINPLFNIVLGMLLFRERLHPAQWMALGLATVGLLYLIAARGEFPWIAFTLATSFAAYGVIRKVAPVDALLGLTVETLFLFPVALVMLLLWGYQGVLAFGAHSQTVDVLLVASGVVTAVPLLCFGAAARRLPLTTLGFLQYLAPTLQFLLAVFYLGEPFRIEQQISFSCIWLALVLVTIDGLLRRRRRIALADAEPSPDPA
ncbi:MAG: EamA family transporter RarD [Gemmataceae bacterium]